MTPQAMLFGAYMQVRNLLSDGQDPSQVPPHGHELPVTAAGYFLAGLKTEFRTEDGLAAFDAFADDLGQQWVNMGNSAESRSRLNGELQMVRDYIASRQPGSGVSPAPDLPAAPT